MPAEKKKTRQQRHRKKPAKKPADPKIVIETVDEIHKRRNQPRALTEWFKNISDIRVLRVAAGIIFTGILLTSAERRRVFSNMLNAANDVLTVMIKAPAGGALLAAKGSKALGKSARLFKDVMYKLKSASLAIGSVAITSTSFVNNMFRSAEWQAEHRDLTVNEILERYGKTYAPGTPKFITSPIEVKNYATEEEFLKHWVPFIADFAYYVKVEKPDHQQSKRAEKMFTRSFTVILKSFICPRF